MAQNFDVVVVGAGPGGYVAAIRCGQLGLKTAVVEREYMGGVCLNVGCIPSKALITAGHFYSKLTDGAAAEMGFKVKGDVGIDMAQMQKWKQSVCDKMAGGVEQLCKGNGVTILRGEASFKTATEITVKSSSGTESVTAKNFIIATGSRPIEIPGFAFDEKTIVSSTGALAFTELPKKLVVIGGGYIGLELGSMYAHLGTEVTVVEANKGVLTGAADPECVQVVARKLKKIGVEVLAEAKAKSAKKVGNGVEVTVEVGGKEQVIKADKVAVTVGRKPNSDQANLKGIGLQIDERGFIKVNAQRRTSIPNIFAIGDIAGQPMLAHKASHEGVLVAEVISGQNRAYDAKTVPAVIRKSQQLV